MWERRQGLQGEEIAKGGRFFEKHSRRIFQIPWTDPDRDGKMGIPSFQFIQHLFEPRADPIVRRSWSEAGDFVAQVPAPDCRVAFKSVDGFMEKALLSVPDLPIRKHVAEAIRENFPFGMNGNSSSVLPGFD